MHHFSCDLFESYFVNCFFGKYLFKIVINIFNFPIIIVITEQIYSVKKKMNGLIVPAAISGFWFIIGFIVPLFIPRGPNKGYDYR